MAVSALMYGLFTQSLAAGSMNLNTDSLKVMLCTSSYTPNQDAHQFKSSITNEVTGTNYVAGGQALTSVVTAYSAGTNIWSLSASNVTWGTSTITARYAVVYDSTPATDATRPLICYIDFGGDVVSAGGAFLITWDAAGVCTCLVS